MRKKLRIGNRLFAILLSLLVVISVVIMNDNSVLTKAANVEFFEYGPCYYIKNVRSGKFLTVQHDEFSVGQKIIQLNYTGGNNQKWKIKYVNGYYQLITYNNAYAISMPSISNNIGLQAQLAVSNYYDDKQLFMATDMLGNGSYRFQTKASGNTRVLLANGASVYNNTSIVQGNAGGQWNDQWLVEIADNKRVNMSIAYAEKNYSHRLATYPNFDYYIDYENKIYESTNFASQCLTAGGYNYYRTGNISDWWYINKKEQDLSNQNYNYEGLTDYWDVRIRWYQPSQLRSYLINQLNKSYQSINNALCFSNNSNYYYLLDNIECKKGDIIFLIRKSDNKIVDVVVSGENADGILVRSMNVYSHSPNSNYNFDNLNKVVMYGTNYSYSNFKLEIYHMF